MFAFQFYGIYGRDFTLYHASSQQTLFQGICLNGSSFHSLQQYDAAEGSDRLWLLSGRAVLLFC